MALGLFPLLGVPSIAKKLQEEGKTAEEAAAIAAEGYSPELRCPENAGIIRRGLITDIQNEDRFSPMNSFAFSPIAQEYWSLDNLILAGIILKLAKSDPKALARLANNYMKNVTGLLTAIVATGKAHPLTALNASTTFAVVAHRFGIITDSGYLKMVDQTRSIIDKLIQLNFMDTALSGVETLVESAAAPEAAGAPAFRGIPALLSLTKAASGG